MKKTKCPDCNSDNYIVTKYKIGGDDILQHCKCNKCRNLFKAKFVHMSNVFSGISCS